MMGMEYNNQLNKIDSQEKAYLLGFLYGDGTITTYKESDGRIRYLTKISINEKDKELINTLHKHFPFLNKNSFDYGKYKPNSNKQYSLSKSSKELFNDLMNNGLYPRKSYENKDKLRLPHINGDLIPHFIRGFFDADGSVYTRAKRKNLITIEFTSVSKEFLVDIDNHLKLNNIHSWKIITKTPKKENGQEYYILQYIKTDEILKLVNYMYNGSTVHLKRKSDRCLLFKPVNKVKDRDLECDFCGGLNIIRNGKRGNSVRYKCKDCGKGYSMRNDKTNPTAILVK